MAYMNKVFVSFDGDNDIRYYNLMRAWKQNNNISFNFMDAHDINTARDNSLEDTIKTTIEGTTTECKSFCSAYWQQNEILVQVRALGDGTSFDFGATHNRCKHKWSKGKGREPLPSGH